MKKLLAAALLCGVVATAWANDSAITWSGINLSAVDSTPDDGIGASFQVLGGTVTATYAVGDSDPNHATTTSFTFSGWPASTLTLSSSFADGSSAMFSFGPDSISVFGSGTFIAKLTVDFDVAVTAGTQLVLDSFLERSMHGVFDAALEPDQFGPAQAYQRAAFAVQGGIYEPAGTSLYGNGIVAGGGCCGGAWNEQSNGVDISVDYARQIQLPGGFFPTSHDSVARLSFLADSRGTAPISPIPEPGTYALMLAGLATVAFMAKRRHLA